MATKTQLDEIIGKEMPGFKVAKTVKPPYDAASRAVADAVTPNLKSLRKKYKMDAAAAPKKPSRGKSQMVVIEPADANRVDTARKRMTVIVRNGKIGPRQG